MMAIQLINMEKGLRVRPVAMGQLGRTVKAGQERMRGRGR